MNPAHIGLDPQALARCFPFHFAIDRDLRVLQAGRSLLKIWPQFAPGVDIFDLLSIRSPRVDLDFESLLEHPRSLFMLALRNPELTLRGQFIATEAGDACLFVGSPWARRSSELEAVGLTMSDFSVHDSALEHLFVQHVQSAAVADATRILDKLEIEATERARLEQAERELEHALNAAGDFRLRTSPDGEILELRAAPTLDALSEPERALGGNVRDVLPELADLLEGVLEAVSSGESPYAFELSLEQSGRTLTLDCRAARGDSGGAIIVGRDVTDRRELESQLEHRALHDTLTELPNRSLLADRLEQAHSVLRSGRGTGLLGLLFIDLDDFKVINDALGHSLGDELLVAIAQRLREKLRPNDTPARLGGDEFAVLLDKLEDPGQALEVAMRLREHIAQPLKLGGVEVRPSCSIGITVSDGTAESEDLFAQADLAMYRIKGEGKGAVGLFEDSMQEQATRRLQVKRDLALALKRDEIILFFQPIVALDSLQLVGVEALVRWQHPEQGLLFPGAFIDIAEDSELIVPLGARIMELALQQVAAWHELGGAIRDLGVSVNLSPKQFARDDVPELFRRCVAESGIDPRRVTLEITESHAVTDLKRTVIVLEALRAQGARVAMDDFGTGFSSLSYLDQLPIDVLKVDKAFVDRLGGEERAPLAESVVALGQTLGMVVVAEGIEESEQMETLRELSCDLGQGYLFSRPLPAQELTARLEAAAGKMPVFAVEKPESDRS